MCGVTCPNPVPQKGHQDEAVDGVPILACCRIITTNTDRLAHDDYWSYAIQELSWRNDTVVLEPFEFCIYAIGICVRHWSFWEIGRTCVRYSITSVRVD